MNKLEEEFFDDLSGIALAPNDKKTMMVTEVYLKYIKLVKKGKE